MSYSKVKKTEREREREGKRQGQVRISRYVR